MSFDGMVTSAVVYELRELLTGGKIEKVYQPESEEIIMHIHSSREKYKLYISASSSHPRIHLIENSDSNPVNPMGFCMLLRKHIQGGRIREISQKDSERIVEISIDTINELGFSVNKKLIIEIMGKHSNIILLDLSTNRIIDSIKRISIDVNRYRQLLPGQNYVYPPTQDKISYFDLTYEKLLSLLDEENPENFPKILLSNIQGISPIMAEEIIYRSYSTNEDENQIGASIFKVISSLSGNLLSGNISPTIYISEDKTPYDFHCFKLNSIAQYYKELPFDSISKAVEYFFTNKNSSNRIKQKSTDLEKALISNLDKLYLKKQRLCEDILKAENSEIYRLYGELLTSNLHNIKSGASSVEVLNYYTNQNETIPLDPRSTPPQNAQKYFKKYAKSKTAKIEKNNQLIDANSDIAYIESVLSHLNLAKSVEEIEEIRAELVEGGYLRKRKNIFSPKKSKPAPYSYITNNGIKLLVGRNNKENDLLTFKMASGKDLWFHTKDIPGSHVILFTQGNKYEDEDIIAAAEAAAYYSKGKDSENVPVDYTQVRYVKKPSGAKPGMVIFTDNKTIYVNPKVPELNKNEQENKK